MLDAFAERAEEALHGAGLMNCSLCQYRVATIGHEHRQGDPRRPHHHHVHHSVAVVVQGVREGPGEPDAIVERADGEQPGVAGELPRRRLDDRRRAEEVQDLWPGSWYTHRWSPWSQK
jgi:hypothetical protein